MAIFQQFCASQVKLPGTMGALLRKLAEVSDERGQVKVPLGEIFKGVSGSMSGKHIAFQHLRARGYVRAIGCRELRGGAMVYYNLAFPGVKVPQERRILRKVRERLQRAREALERIASAAQNVQDYEKTIELILVLAVDGLERASNEPLDTCENTAIPETGGKTPGQVQGDHQGLSQRPDDPGLRAALQAEPGV